jgi:hypothetical protein
MCGDGGGVMRGSWRSGADRGIGEAGPPCVPDVPGAYRVTAHLPTNYSICFCCDPTSLSIEILCTEYETSNESHRLQY